MPELRGGQGDVGEDAEGPGPPEGGGLAGPGVSLPWLRHALSDGPDAGGGGDGADSGEDRVGSATKDAAGRDRVFVLLAEDARRLGMSLHEYTRQHGIMTRWDHRRIKAWEQQGFDLERETDCE